jgi:hypothetical protein
VNLPSEKTVYILWAEGPNTDVPSCLKGQLLVTDLSGKAERIPSSELKLTAHPVFVEQAQEQSNADLDKKKSD